MATDNSCHSFIRMARLAAPMMAEGGTLLAMTFQGSAEVVPNYNVMGPIKAALESAVRYLASELGSRHVRVHAISPGPVATRAASGLKEFDRLMEASRACSLLGELVEIDDVGAAAAFLASPQARRMTGTVLYVDAGLNITG
jgi:enoyl-[acyl-carrier protein] reductase I